MARCLLTLFLLCSSFLPVVHAAKVSSPATVSERINLNQASAKEIAQAYKGFGKVRAEAIVRERDSHGLFESLDDLSRVRGISSRYIAAHRQALEQAYAIRK